MKPSVLSLVALALQATCHANEKSHHSKACKPVKPNFIVVMTDDQDMRMNSLDHMQEVQKRFMKQGTWYKNHFCTVAQCCPSRVSWLTGRAAHNTNITNVIEPYGGYDKFARDGLNDDYLPLWLQAEGYNTFYLGKLMNGLSVDNYHSPWPKGWTSADFLLDPGTYDYYNQSMVRDNGTVQYYPEDYNTDLLTKKSLDYIDEAWGLDRPYFIQVAPIGPHTVVDRSGPFIRFEPPVPAPRHAHMFPGLKIPRTPNFNPEESSSAAWVKTLERLNDTVIEYADDFYRKRIQSLQSVDEMVGQIFEKLESRPGALDNTYIIYTSDNGFHIGQHRMPAGKTCNIEEDVNIPFMIHGPGVAQGKVVEDPTTHVDFAPTIMKLAGIPLRDDYDGEAFPVTEKAHKEKPRRSEAVNIEYWGQSINEGKYLGEGAAIVPHPRYGYAAANNTFKTVRVISKEYNLMYAVWCTGEQELYDMTVDQYQMNNLIGQTEKKCNGWLVPRLTSRLNGLVMSLKACKGRQCSHPWEALHPKGDVQALKDAMHPRFDLFYQKKQHKVSFDFCTPGYIEDYEQPLRPLPFDDHYKLYAD